MISNYKIVPRTDDGTFDVFEQLPNGKLDFVSNHDNLEQAQNEIESMFEPIPQNQLAAYLKDIENTLRK